MQDRHGEHICFLPVEEARELLKSGVATTYGTKKRVHGIRLLVDLREAENPGSMTGKAMSPANYAGARFVFKQSIDNGHGYMVVYRLKVLHETESPEHALLRILTPPALEAATYQPRFKASETERAADPGQERRKRNREIFRVAPVVCFTRPADKPVPVRPMPLQAPLELARPIAPVIPFPVRPAAAAKRELPLAA